MSKQRFDIDLRARGSYKSKFGQAYLKATQEYNIEGSRLIKRVFMDLEEILLYRKRMRLELEQKKKDLERQELKLKTGGL